jgi:hypothetical protein
VKASRGAKQVFCLGLLVFQEERIELKEKVVDIGASTRVGQDANTPK